MPSRGPQQAIPHCERNDIYQLITGSKLLMTFLRQKHMFSCNEDESFVPYREHILKLSRPKVDGLLGCWT
jgi:hypothetical protein